MAASRTITVVAQEAGMRLDRWFRARYPGLAHGALQKLLRTGQVRVDGRRAKSSLRLEAGMAVRVPPAAEHAPEAKPARPPPEPAPAEIDALIACILYRDDKVIVLDKPAGLAVQGGTRTRRHIDGMLDALRFGATERPRLVHRLDKDTSGVLVLARTREAARSLTSAFRGRGARKLYLAVTAGRPEPHRGRIALALAKGGGRGAERMAAAEGGRAAVTLYDTLDSAGDRAALVALMPLTGRTHQLRAHMAVIGTPILGDGKYGGRAAFLEGLGLEKRLHLHARAIEIPKSGGGTLRVEAPLPPHIAKAVTAFGFERPLGADPFPRE